MSDIENKPTGLKAAVGRVMSKKYKFMGEDILIRKLSVDQVLKIQDMNKGSEDGQVSEKVAFESLKAVINMGVVDQEELDDDEFNSLPLDELTTLSKAIMAYSGLGEVGK